MVNGVQGEYGYDNHVIQSCLDGNVVQHTVCPFQFRFTKTIEQISNSMLPKEISCTIFTNFTDLNASVNDNVYKVMGIYNCLLNDGMNRNHYYQICQLFNYPGFWGDNGDVQRLKQNSKAWQSMNNIEEGKLGFTLYSCYANLTHVFTGIPFRFTSRDICLTPNCTTCDVSDFYDNWKWYLFPIWTAQIYSMTCSHGFVVPDSHDLLNHFGI